MHAIALKAQVALKALGLVVLIARWVAASVDCKNRLATV